MKHLLLPIVAVALIGFAMPAAASCSGHSNKDQTAETPQPEPLPEPST